MKSYFLRGKNNSFSLQKRTKNITKTPPNNEITKRKTKRSREYPFVDIICSPQILQPKQTIK